MNEWTNELIEKRKMNDNVLRMIMYPKLRCVGSLLYISSVMTMSLINYEIICTLDIK